MDKDQILLTSRIRLARNIQGYPYPGTMTQDQAKELREKIIGALHEHDDVWTLYDLKDGSLKNLYDLEENLISASLLKNRDRGAYFLGKDRLSVMMMEEDHLRIQAMDKGFHLDEEYKTVANLARFFEEKLPVSYDEELGYLTACPSNMGTGLRAGCMLHLPALDTLGMDKIERSVTRMGFVLRGMRGEGSKIVGHMYQLSNERTLGLSEEDFLKRAKSIS